MRAVLLLSLVTGCATNLANPLETDATLETRETMGPAHGVEREEVEYEMKLRGVTVGRFQGAVGTRGVVDGRQAVVVRSRASLAGVGELFGRLDWDLTTTVDIDSGFAIEETEQVDADVTTHEIHERAVRKHRHEDRHHNTHSAAGALRGWFSAPGATDSLAIRIHDHTVHVDITDAGRETIGTVLGSTPAAKYTGTRNGYPFSIWISDDVARVPLRMQADGKLGQVEVELTSYEVPDDR